MGILKLIVLFLLHIYTFVQSIPGNSFFQQLFSIKKKIILQSGMILKNTDFTFTWGNETKAEESK